MSGTLVVDTPPVLCGFCLMAGQLLQMRVRDARAIFVFCAGRRSPDVSGWFARCSRERIFGPAAGERILPLFVR